MKPIEYLKFWLRSSNEHGVHSPFVFNWITQGLYVKNLDWDSQSKREVFTQRVFAYFKPHKVAWISTLAVPAKLAKLSIFFPSIANMRESTTTVQMIYVDGSCAVTSSQLIEALSAMGNEAFLLMDKRRGSGALNAVWNQMVLSEKTTVTMDFYYYGLIFVRKEQLKQHFSIRM